MLLQLGPKDLTLFEPWEEADDGEPAHDVVGQVLPERVGAAGGRRAVHGLDGLQRDPEEEPGNDFHDLEKTKRHKM